MVDGRADGDNGVVVPMTRRDAEDPCALAELAVEELTSALRLAGLKLGGLRVAGRPCDGRLRPGPVTVDVGEMSAATARRIAAFIRRGVSA